MNRRPTKKKIETQSPLSRSAELARSPRRLLHWKKWDVSPLIGIDEVGRGCLAGPVYAAAVVLNTQFRYSHFTDSKVLSAERREAFSTEILSNHWAGIGFATCGEIDGINILQASFLAMCRAVQSLAQRLSGESFFAEHIIAIEGANHQFVQAHVMVDGHLKIRGLPAHFVQTPVVKGDLRVAPISAASIVAKVARDQFMKDLAGQFPQYGFEAHKGYGTEQHQVALEKWGPCDQHRRSFRGVLPTQSDPK